MAQMKPNYPFMTSSVNKLFIEPLQAKFGDKNVIWPIVLLKDNSISSYLYEKTVHCSINSIEDNRPNSAKGIQSIFVDYTEDSRKIIPDDPTLSELLDDAYSCSYDAVLQSGDINSVDLDYVWCTGEKWKGIELTTVWMPLTNATEAIRLIKMFNRRPSWKGSKGPHGIRSLIDASIDLNIEYWMICVNSIDKVSNNLKVDGNAIGFPLTHDNIDRLVKGETPEGYIFGPFERMINWL